MRIPDYRVWVKTEKKMYGIEYDGFVDYIRACGEPDAFGIDVQIIDEVGMYQSYSFDEVEVMECTGRKDKNGTKIYEGDLVKFNWHITPQKIVFRKGCFCVVTEVGYFESTYWDCEKIEIRGNVCENPELLET